MPGRRTDYNHICVSCESEFTSKNKSQKYCTRICYSTNHKPSLETREKQSLSLKGIVFSEEHKQKISSALKGRQISQETINKQKATLSANPKFRANQIAFCKCGKQLLRRQMIAKQKNCSRSCAQKGNKKGAATKGRIVADETRKKLSLANVGKIISVETGEKIRAKALWRTHSQETKNKISEANKGKTGHTHKGVPKSAEHKLRISVALKGKPGNMLGKKHSQSTKAKMSKNNKNKGQILSKEQREKMNAGRKMWDKERIEEYVLDFNVIITHHHNEKWEYMDDGDIFMDIECTAFGHSKTVSKRWIVYNMKEGCQVCFPTKRAPYGLKRARAENRNFRCLEVLENNLKKIISSQ